MRQKLLTGVLILATTILTACETTTASRRVAVSSHENWVILPIENLSKTPLAGNRARSLLETHLRAQGVRNVEIYQPEAEQSLLAFLDDAGQLQKAKQWAKDQGYVYGITGSVQEWQYKNGLDSEPSVALTLKFVHLQKDEVMWVASAARTGWGYNNVSGVASKAIAELMEDISFREPRRVTRVAAIPQKQAVIQTATTPLRGPLPAATTEPAPAAALPGHEIPANNTADPYLTPLKEQTNR